MGRIIKKIIAVILCAACIVQFSGQAFAAGIGGKTYVKEVFLSYGDTPEEAKRYLTDNGYEIVDHNLNEGADSILSKKRAVYLGYKTTKDSEEAITDMKLMNMQGSYSVLDYQLLLQEQAASIRYFIDNFVAAVSEYRVNYNKGQARAVAAHDLLNVLFDDDTGRNVGDLLLDRIKEEYTDEEFASLTAEEQAKHADMTTILMQSNAISVLAIEQIIALATDSTDTVWVQRYYGAKSYDTMLEELIDKEGLSPSKAETELAALYDDDARIIASLIPSYMDFLKPYTESGITIASPEAEITAYFKDKDAAEMIDWYSIGAQYEVLNCVVDENGTSLLELISGSDNDFESGDVSTLYPIVSVLTEGQRACLEFLPFYQLVSMGLADDTAVRDAMSKIGIKADDSGSVSIYEGVDRAIFGDRVAMTKEANNLQQSSDKEVSDNWVAGGISPSTIVLYVCTGVSAIASIGSMVASRYYSALEVGRAETLRRITDEIDQIAVDGFTNPGATISDQARQRVDFLAQQRQNIEPLIGKADYLSKVLNYVSIGMACLTLVLMGISIWQTYVELAAYYNAEFTPIPMYLVHQGVDEKDEKVYTYYKAVACNRADAGMINDRTAVLEDTGDINGDVGLQWVALYTTTDKSAGQPITADFAVQYANSNIPGGRTALSLFGEKSAQNLTNERNGFTYSDSKDGIYLFYGTDSGVFSGSAISGGVFALIAGVAVLVIVAAYFIISRKSRKGEKAQ